MENNQNKIPVFFVNNQYILNRNINERNCARAMVLNHDL